MKQALIIVDVQRDFCEGGVLPARDTLSLIQPLNDVIKLSIQKNIVCVFTRDWHPSDHCSFISQGGPWAPHCVQGTVGAEFAESLYIPNSALVIDIEKDSDKLNMSYSAFENTNLEVELKNLGIKEIIATGIATDYCVLATVLDSLRYGFNVSVLTDLVRPIDVNKNDSKNALRQMKKAGAKLLKSDQWIKITLQLPN